MGYNLNWSMMMAIYNRVTGERKYIGQIISERGTFRMDTSMDEVTFWNVEEQCPDVFYLAQSDWYVECGQDLSPENKAAYHAYLTRKEKERQERAEKRMIDALKKGETVTVYKGRKVPKGTVGEVFFIKEDFAYSRVIVGLVDSQGKKHYTASTNLKKENGRDFIEVYDDYNKEFLQNL